MTIAPQQSAHKRQIDFDDLARKVPELRRAMEDGYLTRPMDAWTRPGRNWEYVQIFCIGYCRQEGKPFVEVVASSDGSRAILFDTCDQGRAYCVDRDTFLALARKYDLHGCAWPDCAAVGFEDCDGREVVLGFMECLREGKADGEWVWDV